MPRLNQPQIADHPWRKKSCTSYTKLQAAKMKHKAEGTTPARVKGSARWACPACGSVTCEYEECVQDEESY